VTDLERSPEPYHLLHRADQTVGANGTVRFEGERYGARVSFFLVNAGPGEGPVLHVHPYPETWIVENGRARLTVDDRDIEAGPGDIVVVPANTPHGFKAIGPERLRIVCLHPSDRFIQTWVNPPAPIISHSPTETLP